MNLLNWFIFGPIALGLFAVVCAVLWGSLATAIEWLRKR